METSKKQLSEDCSVGEWVSRFPSTRHVFMRYEIDFCIQGFFSLKETCRRKGICAHEVLEELTDVIRESN